MCNRLLETHYHTKTISHSHRAISACFILTSYSARQCAIWDVVWGKLRGKIPEVSFNAGRDLSRRCAHTIGANRGAGKRITVPLLSALNLLRTYRNTKGPRPPVFSRLDRNDCWHQDPASVWNMKQVSQRWDSRAGPGLPFVCSLVLVPASWHGACSFL